MQDKDDRRIRSGLPDRPPVDIGALFADGMVIANAIAAGVAAAFRRHKAAGVPAYVWRDGRVVEIPPDELPDHVLPVVTPSAR